MVFPINRLGYAIKREKKLFDIQHNINKGKYIIDISNSIRVSILPKVYMATYYAPGFCRILRLMIIESIKIIVFFSIFNIAVSCFNGTFVI